MTDYACVWPAFTHDQPIVHILIVLGRLQSKHKQHGLHWDRHGKLGSSMTKSAVSKTIEFIS